MCYMWWCNMHHAFLYVQRLIAHVNAVHGRRPRRLPVGYYVYQQHTRTGNEAMHIQCELCISIMACLKSRICRGDIHPAVAAVVTNCG